MNYWCHNDNLSMKNIHDSIHLYNERLTSLSLSISSLSIPKILHFIWFGPNQLPKYIETSKIMHSNWLIKIWTDDNIKELYVDNRDIFDKADNY